MVPRIYGFQPDPHALSSGALAIQLQLIQVVYLLLLKKHMDHSWVAAFFVLQLQPPYAAQAVQEHYPKQERLR